MSNNWFSFFPLIVRERILFWSDINLHAIFMANLDGTGARVLVSGPTASKGNQTSFVITAVEYCIDNTSYSDGLAWDWISKKLYWTDVRGIEVIDLQTNYRMKVCCNPAMSNWRAIVLDPTTRCVYIQSFIKCLIEVNV